MTLTVSWISYHPEALARGMWDQTIVERTLTATGIPMTHKEGWGGEIVIIGGRFHADQIGQINERINRQPAVMVIITSDEEGFFQFEELTHPNMRLWVQTPTRWWDRTFGFGPSPHAWDADDSDRPLDFAFAGQVTHPRRVSCVKALKEWKGQTGRIVETKSFAKRDVPNEDLLALAKLAPAPSGPVSPDSFRLYEALEAGCLPLVDAESDHDDDYWHRLYGDVPFPVVDDWKDVDPKSLLRGWPANANHAASWWQHQKADLAYRFTADLQDLFQAKTAHPFTVVIPTSPILSHPDTSVIDQTIASIRERTTAPILILADGVRKEQEKYRDAYEEYLRRILWKAGHDWDATVFRHQEHHHQAAMLRLALQEVRTRSILFVEHDTPLQDEIPLNELAWITDQRVFNMVRLHHEARILPDHEHLMVDKVWEVYGQPVHPTMQWSQRPHLANTIFYQKLLDDWFRPGGVTMIEDRMHGIVQSYPWGRFRIGIYSPDGNIQRSTHLDGRGSEPKFESSFSW